MTRRRPKEERQSRPSVCVGCGGAAAGYNYNAPSCFPCKAFFRRTIVMNRLAGGCLKSGMCARGETAQQCRGCRLEKCLAGGMKPELVRNSEAQGTIKEEQQEVGNSAVDEPSTSKSTTQSTPRKLALVSNQELQLVEAPSLFECKVEKKLQMLLSIEAAHQKLRRSSYTPKMSANLTMDQYIAGPSKLGQNFGVMCAEDYKPFPTQIFPVEVIITRRVRMDFSGFDYNTRKLWFFQDVVYSVEFIKALPIYSLLEARSKRILLASALTCSTFTAAFYSYTQRSDRTFYPDGSTMTWDSQMQLQAPESTRYHTAIIAAMKEADLDHQEYVLMKMVVVCNPMLDGLCPADATLLRHEKEHCTKSLFSYVLARKGVEEGPAFFMKLMSILNVLAQLNAWEKGQHILATALGLYTTPTPFGETIFHSH